MATNVFTPLPVGIVAPKSAKGETATLTLDVPRGVKLLGGKVGNVELKDAQRKSEALPDGGRRYRFSADSPRNGRDKLIGRLFVQAPGWSDGQTGEMVYRFSHNGWESRPVSVPLRAVEVKPAPRLKTIMTGLGWWKGRNNVAWPNVFESLRALGFNTFSISTNWMTDDEADVDAWRLLEKARDRGFFISDLDSPYNRMPNRFGEHPEIYCQLGGGKVSSRPCPSYRGEYFKKEVLRFGKAIARVRPDFVSLDIETFQASHSMKGVYQKCSRCRADFKASGLESWDKWLADKGQELWIPLVKAARLSLRHADADPDFEIGGYDFRPDDVYRGTFDFNRLYPKWMDWSQVSTYSPLYAPHIKRLGDEVREDRAKLPRSDVMPWVTPGDGGTFPGEAFRWALLECYANGSRGIWFWSGRLWDAESLIAYNRAVRGIAPVERVIVDGDLVGDTAKVTGPGRVSGMKLDGEMMLLVADYAGKGDGTVDLQLDLPKAATLHDLLDDGKPLGKLKRGKQQITINLGGERARLLHVRPAG